MKAWCVLLVFLVTGCATVSPATTVSITGFRQGLMRVTADGKEIYQVGDSFPYAVNGDCIANYQRQQCMWYGFEFSYETASQDVTLACTTTTSQSATFLSPGKVFGQDMTTFNWPLKLEGLKGFFINPQYAIGPENGLPRVFSSETVCRYDGKEVLRFTFTITGALSNKSLQPTSVSSLRSSPAAAELNRLIRQG
jgi:hypothetical protein